MKARYCKRHRKLPLLQGTSPSGAALLTDPVPALITRYRFGMKRRKPHYVYYYGGRFYRARNCATEIGEDGKPCAWSYALVPIQSATAHDVHMAQTVADGKAAPVVLTIRDGIASATGAKGTPYAGMALLDGSESADYVAALLDLEPTRKQTPRPAGKHFKEVA